MRAARAPLAFLGAALAACGGTAPSAPGSPGTPVAAPSIAAAPPSAATLCAVGGPVAGTPVTDPNGPWAHQVVIARSADGLSIEAPRMVIDHASVPDAVRVADGSLRLYYVDGTNGSIAVARVDGDTVTPLGPITVNGIRAPSGMVDPDATLLADGRIRLYYLNNFGPPGNGALRGMCWADSIDGERFTAGGLAIQFSNPGGVTDPSVAQLSNGSWLMAASRGTASVLARSRDGATFTDESTIGLGGVPELEALDGGRVRLYACGAGIIAWVSADEGRTWTREGTVVPAGVLGARIVCDPSRVAASQRFVFKIQP